MSIGLTITSITINLLCTCSLDIELTVHFLIHCNYYNSARISLLHDLNSVERTLLNLSDLSLVNVLLYGGPQFDGSKDAFILNSSIKYILISERPGLLNEDRRKIFYCFHLLSL